MKSSSTGEIKMWKKTTSHTHSKSAQLSTAAPGAISKSQITAPYLRNHIYWLSAPEIGASLSCALCSSPEMLFICDYRHPLNKRCLCLRSKVSADSELLRFFREGSTEGRTPYLGRVARGGLLQREGWKCSRWEIWDKTSNFSDASYHICFRRGFIVRWGVELTLNAEPYVWNTWRREVLACFLKKAAKSCKVCGVLLLRDRNALNSEEKNESNTSHCKQINAAVTVDYYLRQPLQTSWHIQILGVTFFFTSLVSIHSLALTAYPWGAWRGLLEIIWDAAGWEVGYILAWSPVYHTH